MNGQVFGTYGRTQKKRPSLSLSLSLRLRAATPAAPGRPPPRFPRLSPAHVPSAAAAGALPGSGGVVAAADLLGQGSVRSGGARLRRINHGSVAASGGRATRLTGDVDRRSGWRRWRRARSGPRWARPGRDPRTSLRCSTPTAEEPSDRKSTRLNSSHPV